MQYDSKDPAPAPAAGSDKVPDLVFQGRKVAQHVIRKNNDDDNEQDEKQTEDQTGSDEWIFRVFTENPGKSNEKIPAPEEFRMRPVYKELEEQGLTEIVPTPGSGLFYHKRTNQWHTRFGWEAEKNSAPSWNSTLRSEKRAILMALLAMWEWYAECTKDKTDEKYVRILDKALAETPF